MSQLNDLSREIIGAAIRVHQELGPGFLEAMYEEALSLELASREIPVRRQFPVPIYYHNHVIGEHRLDLLVGEIIVVEIKAVTEFQAIHYATVWSYLKATDLSLGLLLNFASTTLQIRRVGREWHSRAAPAPAPIRIGPEPG